MAEGDLVWQTVMPIEDSIWNGDAMKTFTYFGQKNVPVRFMHRHNAEVGTAAVEFTDDGIDSRIFLHPTPLEKEAVHLKIYLALQRGMLVAVPAYEIDNVGVSLSSIGIVPKGTGAIIERREEMLYLNDKAKGQSLVEYALILVLVAIVVIAVLMLVGPAIANVFSNIVDSI
jgi:pilus assembly protein Flp/PilA